MVPTGIIRTPDQRLRVFVSSTLGELAPERAAVRAAIERLHLSPVMFELGARPHPPRSLYRAYLEQSHVFIGIYWQRYGWIAPEETVSGLEDEYRLSSGMPRLLYIKEPAPDREEGLTRLLADLQADDTASYKVFSTSEELSKLVEDDLAILLTERFEAATRRLGTGDDATDATPALIQPDNPLVGRAGELAALEDLLARPDVRLITITGAAGVGKSRLAIELVSDLKDRYEDGTWLILLESIRDHALIAPSIAQALGVRESAGTSPFESLKRYLSDKRALLVLDNFEQVAAAGPLVTDLLAFSPGVQVVVTSRALLRLRGEHEFPLQPLPVPDPRDGYGVEHLGRVSSVELFVQRARAVDPSFRLTADNAEAVAAICARLEGIPLAIELAAARTRLLPPPSLLARLDDRLNLLTGGARDLPDRHRTLRDAIDWGYELLEPDEQLVFQRLGAFAGGWTLDAAEAVVTVVGDVDDFVLDALESLLAKSLLVRRSNRTAEPRLGMLEIIRDYAREKLLASGDADATFRAHAEHFLTLAERGRVELRGHEQAEWLQVLEQEHANLRAALRWMDAHNDVEQQLRLTAALGSFWRIHAHFSEGRRWCERALSLSVGRRDPLRVDLLNAAGYLARAREDYDLAETVYTEALGIQRELEDRLGEAVNIRFLGNLKFDRGDLEGAHALWLVSHELAQEVGEPFAIADVLNNLGVAARLLGDLDAAEDYWRRNQELKAAQGDLEGHARLAMNLSSVALDRGDYARAIELSRDATARFHEIGDTWDLIDALDFLAAALARDGDPITGARIFGASEALREAIDAARAESEREAYEHDVALARQVADEVVDEEAFDDAWAAGRSYTVDQTVALALGYVSDPGDLAEEPG